MGNKNKIVTNAYTYNMNVPTLKIECFVPAWVQGPAFHFGVQSVLFVRQQCHPDVRVRRATQVHCRQVFGLKHDTLFLLTDRPYNTTGRKTLFLAPCPPSHPILYKNPITANSKTDVDLRLGTRFAWYTSTCYSRQRSLLQYCVVGLIQLISPCFPFPLVVSYARQAQILEVGCDMG